MKNTHILTILALSIITYGMLNEQTLQARSETATEMEKGTAHGEEVAGPVGAVVGGLFGGTVGLAKDTGDVVTGETDKDIIIRDNRYDDDTMQVSYYEDEIVPTTYDTYKYEDIDDLYTDERSETSKEMEKGAASGEDLLGPIGAVAGGIVGTGVGLAKDTSEAVTGREYDEEIVEPSKTEIFMTDDDMDITMIPRDVSSTDNELIMSDVD